MKNAQCLPTNDNASKAAPEEEVRKEPVQEWWNKGAWAGRYLRR